MTKIEKLRQILRFLFLLFIWNIISKVDSTAASSCIFESTKPQQLFPSIHHLNGSTPSPIKTGKEIWSVEFESGIEIQLNCGDGEGNRFKYMKQEQLTVWCVNGTIKTEFGDISFEKLFCLEPRSSSIVQNGYCNNNKDTKFDVNLSENDGATFYWCCHNMDTSDVVYVQSSIRGHLLDQTETTSRPPFSEGGCYPSYLDVNKCYTQAQQTITIGRLLGSPSLAETYINVGDSRYLARGHCMADADAIYSHEKKSTYYFTNVVPQWQCINAGNWLKLENAARSIAKSSNSILEVVTGGWGEMTLKDLNGRPVPITLGIDNQGNLVNKLTCPRFMWKMLYDGNTNRGVGCIIINNPYGDQHLESDKTLCPDKSPILTWVNWDTKDAYKGYMYCCDFNSFYKAIPTAPYFGNIPLLQ